MSRWLKIWPESLKNRACRYLLQHYFGQFLEENLKLNQLSIDLFNGTGQVEDVAINICAINDTMTKIGCPFEVVSGYIGCITVSIPWSSLMKDNCEVQIRDMEITLQPKCGSAEDIGDPLGSLYRSFGEMTTSMQLAEGCLKEQEQSQDTSDGGLFEGLDVFASVIESILSRVQLSLINTIIRFTQLPKAHESCVAVEICFGKIDCFDETTLSDDEYGKSHNKNSSTAAASYENDVITCKCFRVSGLEIFLDEIPYSEISPRSYSPETCDVSDGTQSSGIYYKDAFHDAKSNQTLIAKFFGDHELKVRFKRNEFAAAPKFHAECFIGSFSTLFTPHQTHLLTRFVASVSSSLADVSSGQPKGPYDVFSAEFMSADGDILQPYNDRTSSVSRFVKTDSVAGTALTEDRTESEYATSVDTRVTGFTDIFTPVSANLFSGQPKNLRNHSPPRDRHYKHNAETISNSQYQIHIGGFVSTILHSNPLPSSPGRVGLQVLGKEQSHDGTNLINEGRTKLAEEHLTLVKKYFDACELTLSEILKGQRSLKKSRVDFAKVCDVDHLRLVINGARFNAEIKPSSVTSEISFGKAELTECLFSTRKSHTKDINLPKNIRKTAMHCELLTFSNNEVQSEFTAGSSIMSPDVRVRIKNSKSVKALQTSIHLHLSACVTEVDISIIDRISALLSYSENIQAMVIPNTASLTGPLSNEFYSTHAHIQDQLLDDALSEDHKDHRIDFDASCSFLKVIFRFPIADLRPEMQRTPWYNRSLRDEFLVFEGHDFAFTTSLMPSDWHHKSNNMPGSTLGHGSLEQQSFEVKMKDLHVLFSQSPDKPPTSFIYISQAPSDADIVGESISDLECPFVKVYLNPFKDSGQNLLVSSVTESQGSPSTSCLTPDFDFSINDSADFLTDSFNAHPSPFSRRKVVYNEKEMILPGDAQEMSQFWDETFSASHVSISIQLPAVNMCLVSHSFFENLYNRINNDILLWTPGAPKPQMVKSWHEPGVAFDLGKHEGLFQKGLDLASHMSLHCNDDDSDASSSESDDTISFGVPSPNKSKKSASKKQSVISIMTRIGFGKIVTRCNTTSEGEQTNADYGEVVVMLKDASLFYVMSFSGDPSLDYVCIQIEDFELFHNPSVQYSEASHCEIGTYSGEKPTQMHQVLRRCNDEEAATFCQLKPKGSGGHMVALAIKIETGDRGDRQCIVAVCLNDLFLNHRFAKPGYNWFEQIVDFFNATDDQIPGYEPPAFITIVHLNLNHSAVGYTPMYMSPTVSSVLTVSSFSFSSNIVAGALNSMLDLMVDDAKLYITEKLDSLYLQNDYACILEINVLELGLKMFNESPEYDTPREPEFMTDQPIIEVSMSNNVVMLRTCTDSCLLLSSLLRYLAESGDLPSEVTEAEPLFSTALLKNDQRNYFEEAELEEDETDIVDMMADAMLDARQSTILNGPKSHASSTNMTQSMIDMRKPSHLYNTEGRMYESLYPVLPRNNPGVMDESGWPCDDEFCIIDDDLTVSYCESEPAISYRGSNHEDVSDMVPDIEIMDDHFEPHCGKIDQLQAPKHFPTPLVVYTLNELSLIWHMYGGSDFISQNSHSAVAPRRMSSPAHTPYQSPKASRLKKLTSSRDSTMRMELHATKISARYEEYPDHTYEAKRFIFVINEFEIRDRLRSSSINKFLYRFHSESSPRQAHAKALLFKVLEIRPEGIDGPTENRLRLSLQPLRLNVDQDTLCFLTNFFSEISGTLSETQNSVETASSTGRASPLSNEDTSGESRRDSVNSASSTPSRKVPNRSALQREVFQPIFFREVVFSPSVPIRLDYHGKRIDTELGTISGLLMGLGQLNCSQLELKRITNRRGLLGIDRLVTFLLNEWASDIRANQLPSILVGVGPMHSVTQVFKGIKDLFYLPVEQYRKDGRIIRGIQKGATSFGTSTAMATLEMTNRAISLVQTAAETTYELVSPGNPQQQEAQNWHTLGKHARRSQPSDIREGVSNALTVVKTGVEDTTISIVKLAQKEHGRKGVTAAVGVVLRHIPSALVRPVIMSTEATSNVLCGIRNQIKPDAKQQDEDKWKNTEGLS